MDLFKINRFIGDKATARAEESQLILDQLHQRAEQRKRERQSHGQTPRKKHKRQHGRGDDGTLATGIDQTPALPTRESGDYVGETRLHEKICSASEKDVDGVDIDKLGVDSRQRHKQRGGKKKKRDHRIDEGRGEGSVPPDNEDESKKGEKKKNKERKSLVVNTNPDDDSGIEWPEASCPEDLSGDSPHGIKRSRKKSRKDGDGHGEALGVQEGTPRDPKGSTAGGRELAEGTLDAVEGGSTAAVGTKKSKKKRRSEKSFEGSSTLVGVGSDGYEGGVRTDRPEGSRKVKSAGGDGQDLGVQGEVVAEVDLDSIPNKKKKKKNKKRQEDDVSGVERIENDSSISRGNLEEDATTPKKQKKNKRRRNKEDVMEEAGMEDTSSAGVGKPQDAGGIDEKEEDEMFPVLGDFMHSKKEKVTRVLPEWLARPTKISSDITGHSVTRDSIPGLDSRILSALDDMKITSFFPVQAKVIPLVLQSARHGVSIGPAGYRPGDLCVAAPTGSGKTLAFAIPLVQLLMDRVVQRLRALVVLPTKDLAAQVYRVFLQLAERTPLQVVMIGGQRTLKEEGAALVKQSVSSQFQCSADVVVATPGRLVDHINHTEGFNLRHLRFLVIDEADNLMVQHSKDWISRVEREIEGSRSHSREITVESEARMVMPFQKLLFSATLSHNPEHLIHFKLFQPRLVSSHDQEGTNGESGERANAPTAKYVTPASLEEHYIVCDISEKPLLIVHLLKNLGCTQVLCFTNSVEASHRLYLLMTKMAGIQVGEFSSKLSGAQRQSMIKQFKNETIQLLICSDVMARGMDLSNVNYVVSYDAPLHLKTYIHRVGRTARAGRKGTAYTILLENEVSKFERIVGKSSATGIRRVTVTDNELEPFREDYQRSLKRLPLSLKDEIYQQKNR